MELLDKKNKIYLLDDNNHDFPTLEMMKDDLVAVGGDFHPQRLINAYKNGIFPWFIDDYNYIHWFSPKKRMVLFPNEFKLSKSLKRTINNKGYIVKTNENFEEVMRNCSNIKRKHEDETWIDENFIIAYTNLNKLDFAYSIECYLDEELVGGLYGVMINDIFCGESMFAKQKDASKVALYHLCNQAEQNGIKLIDCQVYNKHLASLGAKEIPREEYIKLLKNS
ncbi:leucyl/phenylalanyl-tRNA--protein transferase [Halarcobacter ebronensis]|uniref:Leucyl/phenylalanyl-tRNA--protein transferase n=1 Tax=Halarcobacter ebronensis TaxID=1462615 RepID=A0A4Q1AN02_9BACT|nr:leucyl/phenylalanyl-tRNA--protein transferase [Halarcobacter ebronensis]QKF82497.1 leucyl, phenylalanyl-tRNA-protein transferase [Halarcobacter ebronensis]RXK07483.1 leucyl/phenylalanyl-tRNA--protein transferase [Halarcobacter ebronensis]